eukprot:4080601-Alexandrium_andersonii.AAC.1
MGKRPRSLDFCGGAVPPGVVPIGQPACSCAAGSSPQPPGRPTLMTDRPPSQFGQSFASGAKAHVRASQLHRRRG